MDSISIFAVDVGSPKNFAWARNDGSSGVDGDGLVAAIANALGADHRIALGFECPLFIPIPFNWACIGKRRVGEDNRPWSAGAGGGVAIYGLHEMAWTLIRLRTATKILPRIFFSPDLWFSSREPAVLLWEAFVSGADKGADHAEDARKACRAFERLLSGGTWDEASRVRVPDGARSLNLAAFAAYWAGWQVSPADCASQLLVVRPKRT
jgi:hypothetical protein